MNRILLFIALFAIQPHVFAINFAGVITGNTTWTKANSPYIVTGHVLVDSNATLTIEPGVEILMPDVASHFYIEGNIIAIGTPTDSILIHKQAIAHWWTGFEFRNTSSMKNATFQYCCIKNAQQAIKSSTNMQYKVTNCRFTDNWNGLAISGGKWFIQNNLFQSNYGAIVEYSADSGSEISENEICYNDNGASIHSTTTVTGNHIHHNKEQGIELTSLKFPFYTISQFSNNRIEFNDVGLYVHDVVFLNPMNNNIIAYNQDGIVLAGTIKGDISQNTLKHNDVAIYVTTQLLCTLSYNCIDSNKINAALNSTVDADLKDNYWGSTDSAIIDSKMIDYDQLFVGGRISFMPLLTQPDSSCKSLEPLPTEIPTVVTAATCNVYPNPFVSTFTIESVEGARLKEVTIFDISGRIVYATKNDGPSRVNIPLGQSLASIYLYRVLDENGQVSHGKIWKQ